MIFQRADYSSRTYALPNPQIGPDDNGATAITVTPINRNFSGEKMPLVYSACVWRNFFPRPILSAIVCWRDESRMPWTMWRQLGIFSNELGSLSAKRKYLIFAFRRMFSPFAKLFRYVLYAKLQYRKVQARREMGNKGSKWK